MGRICFSNKSRKNNRQRRFEGSTGRCFHVCRRCQVLLVTRNNTVTEQSKVPAGRFSTVAGRSVCSGTEGGLLFDGSFAFDIFAWESLSCCSFLQRAWRWDICNDHCEDVQSKVYNSKPKSTIMCTENSGSGMCCAEYRILPLCSALTARVFLSADHLGALIVTLHLHAKTVI